MRFAKALKTVGLLAICALALATPGAGQTSSGFDAATAFERLKALQGTWQAETANAEKASTTFELVANGTVLMEHYKNPAMPGGGHMVSAYHLDGGTLVLTHY